MAQQTFDYARLSARIEELKENPPPPLSQRAREVIMSAFSGFTPTSGGDEVEFRRTYLG